MKTHHDWPCRSTEIEPFEPISDAAARVVARLKRCTAIIPSQEQVREAEHQFYAAADRFNETEAEMSAAYLRWADLRARASL